MHLNPTIHTQTAGLDKQLTDGPEDQNTKILIHISASWCGRHLENLQRCCKLTLKVVYNYNTLLDSVYICGVPAHHSALVWIIKPLQQLNTGALPAAAAAHKGQRLTGLHRHIQPIQDLDVWPGGVGELAVNEVNVPLEVILKTQQRGREKYKGWCLYRGVLGCHLLSTEGR